MKNEKKIEIPFGAFDSELIRQEISIPNGFKAVIDGNKIILTRIENEDEKIRKALVKAVSGTLKGTKLFGTNVTRDEALAWLEKQGEEQPIIRWHSISEEPEEMKELFCEWESDDATWHDVAFYDEESHTFRHAKMPINVTKWVYVDELLEKQGEQKPNYTTLVETGNGGINALVTRELPTNGCDEQKPAWSDEDERTIKEIDEIIYECPYCESKEEISNWLKSLKQRYTWKPSDEQMESLEFVIKSLDNMFTAIGHMDNYTKPRLEEILEALKKLREE